MELELKKIHKQSKKKREDVAIAINIKKSTLDSYLDGKANPKLETLIMLADYYNVSIDEIVGIKKTNNLIISNEKKELHNMIEQLTMANYGKAKISVAGLLAGQN